MRRPVLLAAAGCLALSVLAAPGAGATPVHESGGAVFTGETTKTVLPSRVHSQSGKNAGNLAISYHNGPVMTSGVTAYFIYYGDWSTTGGQPILETYAKNLSNTPYWNINTGYYDAARKYISSTVGFGKAVVSQTTGLGTALSDANIATIVSNELTSGTLPTDPNGVYFVLTAKGVTETSGFLTQYCGWHTKATLNGAMIKYSFVGNADGPSLSSCAAQTTSSPNGNPGVDAMVSVLAHELEEAATDPQLNAWYDSRGYENADKCAWTFGTTSTASNGSSYNMTIGGLQYLIQQNWKIGTGCALK